MCGLVYGLSLTHRPINKMVQKQFYRQKSRGTEGFGVFDAEYGNLIRIPAQHKMMKWVKKHPSKELLFHHRYPTSTDNVKNACHPFSSQKFFETNYILAHNGVVHNARDLKLEHDKLGINYSSLQKDGRFNDSEALMWDFALYMEGKQDKMKSAGSIAFIAIAVGKDGSKLHYAHNDGNPLKILKNNKAMLISSEGAGTEVPEDHLHTYDYATGKITTKELDLRRYPLSQYKYEYDGYGYDYDYEEHQQWRYGLGGFNAHQERLKLLGEASESDQKLARDRIADNFINAIDVTPTEEERTLKEAIQERYKKIMLKAGGVLYEAQNDVEIELELLSSWYDEEGDDPLIMNMIQEEADIITAVMTMIEDDPAWGRSGIVSGYDMVVA